MTQYCQKGKGGIFETQKVGNEHTSYCHEQVHYKEQHYSVSVASPSCTIGAIHISHEKDLAFPRPRLPIIVR